MLTIRTSHRRAFAAIGALAIAGGLAFGSSMASGSSDLEPHALTAKEIMADGRVTDAEQHQAVVNMIACLRSEGVTASDPIDVQGTGAWSYTYSSAPGRDALAATRAASDACYAQELAAVEDVYEPTTDLGTDSSDAGRHRSATQYVDCLAEEGLADPRAGASRTAIATPSIDNLSVLHDAATAEGKGSYSNDCLIAAGLVVTVDMAPPAAPSDDAGAGNAG